MLKMLQRMVQRMEQRELKEVLESVCLPTCTSWISWTVTGNIMMMNG